MGDVMEHEAAGPRYETIEYEVSDGVATVTLCRPHALNAFSVRMQQDLAEAIGQLAEDDSVRAVVLTGAGRGFCAGGDIQEMHDVKTSHPTDSRKKIQHMLRTVLMPLVRLEKPVIAAVHGAAVGAGMNLALAADIVLAAENARLSQIFVKVGLVPDTGGLYLLTRLIGLNRAKELCFTGRMLDAQEAFELGLVNRVVPNDRLQSEARSLALQLARGPSVAIGLTKTLLNHASSASLDEMAEYEAYALAVSLSTADHREGIRAFQEKREPNFLGN